MTDTPKPCWFNLITPEVLGRVGGVRRDIDPRAADQYVGDNRNQMDVLKPSDTQDVYGIAVRKR